MPRIALNSRRSRTSCSVIALATVLAVGATPAKAQSFNGAGVFVNPAHGTINQSVADITTVTLNTGVQQAVINWTPTENATNTTANIVFQDAGTTANFNGSSDFAVLNNINSASLVRAIEMNGTINTQVGTSQRGSVYFYAPGGFVLGGSSVFNVGSLVVSALPIATVGSTFISNFGTDNTVVFNQAPNSNAVISSNGTITANVPAFGVGGGGDSYVAMVAPKVAHSGAISVNGSAALVAAEAATMSFSTDGLFDIQVTVGSDDDFGVTVSGDIGGQAPVDVDDQQRVYLVAVPKNDAMTMIISNGANLGFTLAGSAAIDDNGAVILSAGHDIANGQIAGESEAPGSGVVNFWFTGAHATSNLFGEATGYADLYSTDAQASQLITTFDSDVTVHAADHVSMTAWGTDTVLTVGGDLNLSTDAFASGTGGSATGGETTLSAAGGGNLTVTGDVTLSANGWGGSSEGSGVNGGNGTGGLVDVNVSGGSLNLLGNLSASATGLGGQGDSGFTSGDGQGGNIAIRAFADGYLTIANGLTANASGTGGHTDSGANGGDGYGGTINLTANGTNAQLTVGSYASLYAHGQAGYAIECTFCGGPGGEGIGGDIFVSASGTNATMSLPSLSAYANGQGGLGVDANGGYGEGGWVQISAADDGSLSITNGLYAEANGRGGNHTEDVGDVDANRGGHGVGGTVELMTSGTGTPEIHVAGWTALKAQGDGGDVYGNFSYDYDSVDGDGGDGTGGRAGIYSNAGRITDDDIDNDGGIRIDGGGYVDARGFGGNADGGTGGDGFGMNAEIFAIGGDVEIGGGFDVRADGYGGYGNFGGDGFGGGEFLVNLNGAHIYAENGDIVIGGSATVSASGTGGNGVDGDFESNGGVGGNGFGGYATIHAANSNAGPSLVQITGVESTAFVTTDGYGGAGGDGGSGNTGGNGGAGGTGDGGFSGISAAAGNGHVDIGFASLSSQGFGGDGGAGGNGDGGAGGNGGIGGNGIGGRINVGTESGSDTQAAGSNLGVGDYGSIFADASASGGRGGDGNFGATSGNGGDGGDATGGASVLLIRGSTVNVDSVTLQANADGGDAGFGYFSEVGTSGTTGIGGDATVGGDGGIAVLATNRYFDPPGPIQRGTLNAGSITGTAIASSGIGIPDGDSVSAGGSQVTFLNSDGNIGSLDFEVGFGGQNTSSSGTDSISLINSTVLVDGTFSYTTPGNLSFLIDNGSLTAGTLALSAGNFVTDPVNAPPLNRGTAIADDVFITSGGDFIADANFDVTNTFIVDVPGSIRVGNVTDDNGIDFTANGGSISIDGIDAGTFVDLYAEGNIDTDDILAGSSVAIESVGGSIGIGNIDAGSNVTLLAGTFIAGEDIDTFGSIFAQSFGGDIGLENLTATFGTITLDAAGDIFLSGDLLADGDIDLTADGNILMHNATSHQSVDINGGGYVDGDDLTAGDTVEVEAGGFVTLGNLSAGIVNPSFNLDADYVVAIQAGGNIHTGNIEAAQHIGLATPGTMLTGTIDAGGIFMALGHGNMTFLDANAGSEIYLADFAMMALGGGDVTDEFDPAPILASAPTPTGGSIIIGNVTAGKFTAAAGTSLTTGIIDSGGGIGLGAGGAIHTGNLFAGDFVLANGGSITTGNIEADSVEMTSTGGDITTENISAFGDVELDAFGDILTGDITAGSIDLFAGDDITTGDLTTHFLLLLTDGGITTQLFPGASITLEAGGDIATGNIDSIDGVYANAGGTLSTGTIDANDFVTLFSVGNMSFGNSNAGSEFQFESDGSVIGGNIVAGVTIEGEAGGTVTLQNLTAGFDPGEFVDDDTFSVGIQAIGSISVVNVQGEQRVGFATLGDLTTGSIQTGWDFFAFADGNIVTGAITTGASDNVFMSGTDAFFDAGGGEDSDFDPEAALAGSPSPTGGSITINGPVNTGLFRAAAGTGLTTQAITADDIQASAGGTAALNGIWSTTGSVTLSSNDIDITGTGGINAQEFLTLISTNGTQAQIGDGLPVGAVYALSNAEFGRISGYEIDIIGRGDASSPFDMLIGDLNVKGPLAESNVEGSDLNFATGNFGEGSASGVIRVVGDINATGFAVDADQSVNFFTGRFELDAATGSISIFSSGTTLGGELGIYADRIHIAEGAILNQLASNPTYTGYQQDLNEAATVQRPEGVLRADTLWIESDNLQDILIQNTGSGGPGGTPAGFLVRQAFVNEDFEVAGPAGSINLVVNGQVVTEGGTLTGVAARDELITEETDIAPFTANSTINGCPLTGPCIIRPPEPPPTANVVDNQIDLITGDPLGDSEFGNEDSIDDNQEGDEGANNPISPPQPLFDTRPLIPSSDVNDPVSGTGNPALLGTAGDCPDDDETQCGTKKEGGQ